VIALGVDLTGDFFSLKTTDPRIQPLESTFISDDAQLDYDDSDEKDG
jgi:hypothetical protein